MNRNGIAVVAGSRARDTTGRTPQTTRSRWMLGLVALLLVVALASGAVLISGALALPEEPGAREELPKLPVPEPAAKQPEAPKPEGAKEKPEPLPPPKVAEQPKPKPPAPKGFEDLRLGMTRKAVHQLTERWKRATVVHDRDGTAITNVPYEERIQRILVRFEDDKGLARNTKSADLAPDEAEARLTFIAVEFKLEGGSPEALLEPLRKEFGRPDHEGKPQPVGHFGFAFRMDVGPVMAAERRLAWTWKDVDRAVIASVTQYGEHTFGKLRDITMQLVYVDGLFAQEAVKEALEKERKRREQEQAAAAAEAIRKGISGGGKAPEAPKSGATSEKSLPIPDTLLGHWRVRGQHGRQRWEGYLRLEKNTDAEARGELEWLEGHRPGLLPVKAVVIQSGRTNACTLVLRTDCDVLVGNGEPAAYAAVVSKDQKELHTGGWQGPEWSFSWRATKLENTKTKAKHASLVGKWVINGAASFTLQEEGTLSPLRGISGVYTDRPWVATDQIRTLHLAGSFNLHTRRVWFRAVRDSGESVFTYEGYLSADGTGMYGQDTDGQPWSALRDHLVSVQKRKWFLDLPVFELTPGPGHVSLERATAFLEAMIDVYNIDLAIRTNSGEYRCLGRKTGNSRATSRLRELPKGSAWFEFKGDYPGDDTYLMKTFNTVLRKYGLPRSDAVLLVLPPALAEEMLGLELHYLKKEKKLDDRRHIRETTFEFTYDKQKRRLNLGVKRQSAVYALSW